MDCGGWEELQGKDESSRSRFEHIVRERHGVMATFGNPGKKRKLSRKRKVRKKIEGRMVKKGEIL